MNFKRKNREDIVEDRATRCLEEIIVLQREIVRGALKGDDTTELEQRFMEKATALGLPGIADTISLKEVERC